MSGRRGMVTSGQSVFHYPPSSHPPAINTFDDRQFKGHVYKVLTGLSQPNAMLINHCLYVGVR